MSTKRYGLLLIFAFIASGQTCTRYEGVSPYPQEQKCGALTYMNNSYYKMELTPCPFGTHRCEIIGGNYEYYCSALSAHKYPGDYCESDADCISGTCQSSLENTTTRCIIGSMSNCTFDFHCDAGQFCDLFNNSCEPLAKLNQSCSDRPCDVGLYCENETCLVIAQKANGYFAVLPFACKSMYVRNMLCHAGPILVASDITASCQGYGACPCNNYCKYSVAGTNFTDGCFCGLNPSGDKFCPPGRGDMDFTDYSSYVEEYLEAVSVTGQDLCHVSLALSCYYRNLANMSDTYFEANLLIRNISSFFLYYTSDDNVMETIDPDYYYMYYQANLRKKNKSNTSFNIIPTCAGAVFSCIVVLCLLHFLYNKGKNNQRTTKEKAE